MRGEGKPFWKKVLLPPLKLPPSFPKTFIREDDRVGELEGLLPAAGLRRCSWGEFCSAGNR
ncbi:hypothetical protein DESPIG_02152 [Desulfovibrio piger ATCC 29098]|uniref:Uncharacterized protein n=1 Tax=Desulfovibrio piger ATCC 29098 TaxID=411464 RepID=B6WVN4_9BACT|nr:hypothetical protein DESPIG_02152 [Desulfovibrio piger ATCC 29098]